MEQVMLEEKVLVEEAQDAQVLELSPEMLGFVGGGTVGLSL
jgi:hypothetical protein